MRREHPSKKLSKKRSLNILIADDGLNILTLYKTFLEIKKGHLEKTLLRVQIKLNRTITTIKKPFSLDVLDHIINSNRGI